MRFSKEILDELRAAAGDGATVSPSKDSGHVDVQVSTTASISCVLRIAGRERIPVFTRLFPFGSIEQAGSGFPSIVLDTTKMSGIIEYSPADMVLTARAGTRLAEIQALASANGQRLAIDPPSVKSLTIGEAVAKNEWGPHRTGHGTIRDHLLGCQVVLPNGEIWKSGGRVVKSATGYDFHRAQVGALESLAVGAEFTVRLKSRPVSRATMVVKGPSMDVLIGKALRVRDLPDGPTALFVLGGPAGKHAAEPRLCARYEGSIATVDMAVSRVDAIFGGERVDDATGEALLAEAREGPLEPGFESARQPGIAVRLTCRPSRVGVCVEAAVAALERFASPVFVCAHPGIAAADLWVFKPGPVDPMAALRAVAAAVKGAGGGTVRLRRPFENHGGAREGVKTPVLTIMENLKRRLDPHNILNAGILPFPVKPSDFAPARQPEESAGATQASR